jgi:CBS domain-containing protein
MDQPMLEASRTGPSLEQLQVADAMHPGVVTCPLETPLREVARMMALYRIHAVVAFGESSDDVPGPGLWGVVSDLDLVRAVGAGELDGRTAGGTAVTPVVLVAPNELLTRAAQLMTEHDVTHLVVMDPQSTRPIGVLSTLDIARALVGLS